MDEAICIKHTRSEIALRTGASSPSHRRTESEPLPCFWTDTVVRLEGIEKLPNEILEQVLAQAMKTELTLFKPDPILLRDSFRRAHLHRYLAVDQRCGYPIEVLAVLLVNRQFYDVGLMVLYDTNEMLVDHVGFTCSLYLQHRLTHGLYNCGLLTHLCIDVSTDLATQYFAPLPGCHRYSLRHLRTLHPHQTCNLASIVDFAANENIFPRLKHLVIDVTHLHDFYLSFLKSMKKAIREIQPYQVGFSALGRCYVKHPSGLHVVIEKRDIAKLWDYYFDAATCASAKLNRWKVEYPPPEMGLRNDDVCFPLQVIAMICAVTTTVQLRGQDGLVCEWPLEIMSDPARPGTMLPMRVQALRLVQGSGLVPWVRIAT